MFPQAVSDNPIPRRILLVEDAFGNQQLIAHVLRKAGAEVTVAENGQVAVDLASATTPAGSSFDIILMDIHMPVMDGYEATKRLRSAGCLTPIIALTACSIAEHRQKCLDAGCDDYMTKPCDWAVLLKRLAQCDSVPAPEKNGLL
jgi:CheY-like chemotaxis protein